MNLLSGTITAVLAACAIGCAHSSTEKSHGASPAEQVVLVISTMDPTSNPTGEQTIAAGQRIDVVLPEYNGSDGWTITKGDDVLGKPTEGMVDLWGGPNLPGHKFSWQTATGASMLGDHVIHFSVDTQPPTTFVATIRVVATTSSTK